MTPFPLQQHNRLRLTDSGVYRSESEAISYSEGSEAEEYLRQVFENAEDLSSVSEELERAIRDWSSEYHLASTRANILRCLNLEGISNALELGCGCGSITRYLGELGIQVDAVEGGPSRAELARMRCRDLENVEIVQANFNELQLPPNCYDAVFLIGVIEYAALFSPGLENDREAVAEIFFRIRRSLKPGGILVLALENRMGLKYFMGAEEDHLGIPFVGLYDYPGGHGVRSYSRQEWQRLFRDNGWEHFSFLYPFPDYKLPRIVLGEQFVKQDPFAHSLLCRIESRSYLSSWTPLANEFLSWKGVHRAGLLPELANSFLIVASSEEISVSACADKDFVHFSGAGRRSALRSVTEKPAGAAMVYKRKLSVQPDSGEALEQHLEEAVYQDGDLLITRWIENLFAKEPFDSFALFLQEYFSFLLDTFDNSDNPGGLIDLLPTNIIIDPATESWKAIDLEWVSSHSVSAEDVFFRAVFWFAEHNRQTLAGGCRQLGMLTVEDFVRFCFRKINRDFQLLRAHYIAMEEQLHKEIVFCEAPGLDVSYILAEPLERMAEGGSGIASEEVNEGCRRVEKVRAKKTGGELAVAFAKRSVKMVKSHLLSSHCRKLRRSGIFDSEYYCSRDNAFRDLSFDPLLHYVETGFREGRDPSPLFSLKYYREQYPHLEEEGLEPLLHYLEIGWKEGARTHPFFDSDYDYQVHSSSGKQDVTPLELFVKQGLKQGEICTPYFDPQYYSNRYPDVAAAGMLPLLHYLNFGGTERRQPGPFFDPGWYVDRTPVFGEESGDLLEHYLRVGAGVGKSPVPVFDRDFYEKQNEDAAENGQDIFGHYLKVGIRQDRQPCSWFDPSFYREICPNLAPYRFPLEHYLCKGVYDGLYVHENVANLRGKPVVSILVPVYNVEESYLNCCIRSVLFQSYPHWELCLVDDCSSESYIRPQLKEWAAKDKRIKIKFLEKNQGIARASNVAADLATGQFLIFLDNDDELHPEALFFLVEAVCSTGADLLYTDEDLIGDDGSRFSVFYKPDFNRELLYNHNYVTHPVLTSRALFDAVGGFSPAMSGAQDFDLFLKLSEKAKRILHLPQVLYHWRAIESSTSINHGQKEYADESGRLALAAAMERQEKKAAILSTEWKFFYRVKKEIQAMAPVSVAILYREDADFIDWLKDLISLTRYPEVEFLVLADDEQLKRNGCEQGFLTISEKLRLIPVAVAAGPAARYNETVSASRGGFVIFLNSRVQLQNTDWIEAMLEYGEDQDSGMIGGRILPAQDEELVAAVPDLDRESSLYYARFVQECSRHMNGLQCPQNVFTLSWNLAMIAKARFEEIGGFDDESFSCLFADSDFCLRMRAKGYENVYTPFALGQWLMPEEEEYNFSEKIVGQERRIFQKHWQDELRSGDPYYNRCVLSRDGVEESAFLKWYTGEEGD